MGATRKSGPIFIIFCGDIQYPIRTQCIKFQRIRLKNALKHPKKPKFWAYPYMGAMPKRGPIQPIIELDLPADKRRLYAKIWRFNFWQGDLFPHTTTKYQIIYNFLWRHLVPNRNPMYQISANSVEKRAQEPQNTENWGVNLYGSYA